MNILENIKEFLGPVTITEIVISLTGIILFGIWLLRTSFGIRALENSPHRRNNMPLFLPFILFMASYGIIAFVGFFTSKFFYTGPLWKIEIIDYAFNSLAGIIAILIILIFSYIFFARGLKGFGLNIKTLHKDLLAAFVNLLAVWPIMLVVLILTMFFAKIINGSDYQIQKHEGLVSISENTVIWAQLAIAFAAIIVTPVLEELLFRGLLQTTFRSALRTKYAAWIAIALTAMLFAMMHSIPAHWPTLFVLGACMGYSYEKSGSLFRPIFIHAIFNATSIIGVLIQ